MIDLHVHTSLCRHATGEISEYVAAARDRGVDVMAFTDHLPLLDADDTDYAMSRAELPRYVEEVRAAAAVSETLEVLLGIEADWCSGREDDISELLEGRGFDLVLGSVHFIDGWAFDDPRRRDGYEQWAPDDLWRRYFEDLEAAARSGLFDVMAHPDLVKKFDYRPESDPRWLFEHAAEVLAEAGVAVEVSTAGLRRPCAEIYPSDAFLSACRRRDVPVTIGSDAHIPEQVGYAYDEAVEALTRAGYRSVLVFRERKAEEVPLP